MSEAEDIVKAILEADDLDLDTGDKDAYFNDEIGIWVQKDGDWGDPWVYGGTWHNEVKGLLLHFYGTENEKEIEPENVEVPPYTLAKIKAMVHDPDLDEEWAKEDPAWLEKQLKDEEWEVERKVGEYQYAKAAFLNARKPYDFELFELEDTGKLPSQFEKYVDEMRKQFDDPEEFLSWPLADQIIEILNYAGWTSYADQTLTMNRKEASAYLGKSL